MNKKYLLVLMAASASFCCATKIGLLKKDANYSCDKEISMTIDVEDSNNGTDVKNGDKNPPGIYLGGRVRFEYCVVDVDEMPKTSFDYIVLSLDKKCPAGSVAFTRYHDTEDSDCRNTFAGHIAPNVVDRNALFYYCFVPKKSGQPFKYPFSKEYGIFANKSATNLSHSEIYIDDEDDNYKITGFSFKFTFSENTFADASENSQKKTEKGDNYAAQLVNEYIDHKIGEDWSRPKNYDFSIDWDKDRNTNSWGIDQLDSDTQKRIKNIMSGDKNTTYHVVKWNGKALAKQSASVLVENSVPAAKIISESIAKSPAIVKTIDRTFVGVEVRSAGDVEVSLVDANGQVLVKSYAENVQPGYDQIAWDATNVPSGKYIATIKQNGMIKGKKVFLK